MTGMRVRQDESFEKALKRFRRMIERAGIIGEYKRRQHFIKKSERRHQKVRRLKRKRYLQRRNKKNKP